MLALSEQKKFKKNRNTPQKSQYLIATKFIS